MMALRITVWPLPLRQTLRLGAVMVAAALLSRWATPDLHEVVDAPNLEATVPDRFGDWAVVPTTLVPANLAVAADGRPSTDQPYDQIVTRTYRNGQGELVMLALAYGRTQRQEVKIHRPELCYPAQGFQVLSLQSTRFDGLQGERNAVTGKLMVARSGQRTEAVSYWIRIGQVYSDSAWVTRWHILREGLQGRVPDGILVRASRPVATAADAERAYPAMDRFLADLVAASPPATRALMVR